VPVLTVINCYCLVQAPGLTPLSKRVARVQQIAACLQHSSASSKGGPGGVRGPAKEDGQLQQHRTGRAGGGSHAGPSSNRPLQLQADHQAANAAVHNTGITNLMQEPGAETNASNRLRSEMTTEDDGAPGGPHTSDAPPTSASSKSAPPGASATHYERFLVAKEAEQHLPALFAQLEVRSSMTCMLMTSSLIDSLCNQTTLLPCHSLIALVCSAIFGLACHKHCLEDVVGNI
jgi:hypothetical protein